MGPVSNRTSGDCSLIPTENRWSMRSEIVVGATVRSPASRSRLPHATNDPGQAAQAQHPVPLPPLLSYILCEPYLARTGELARLIAWYSW